MFLAHQTYNISDSLLPNVFGKIGIPPLNALEDCILSSCMVCHYLRPHQLGGC